LFINRPPLGAVCLGERRGTVLFEEQARDLTVAPIPSISVFGSLFVVFRFSLFLISGLVVRFSTLA
jgi:hypothetical protein